MGNVFGNRKGPAPVSDYADLFQFTRTDLAISAVAAQTAALVEGRYDVWSDVDCFIKIHTTANDVTTGNGYLLRANNTVTIAVREDHRVGAITTSASGTLSLHRVG
jgi:hypothetical protein